MKILYILHYRVDSFLYAYLEDADFKFWTGDWLSYLNVSIVSFIHARHVSIALQAGLLQSLSNQLFSIPILQTNIGARGGTVG
jgi:hypothetical protein